MCGSSAAWSYGKSGSTCFEWVAGELSMRILVSRALKTGTDITPAALKIRSDSSRQQQDEQYQHQQSDTATRAVTPVSAVTPGREHTHQRQYKHDQKNGSD